MQPTDTFADIASQDGNASISNRYQTLWDRVESYTMRTCLSSLFSSETTLKTNHTFHIESYHTYVLVSHQRKASPIISQLLALPPPPSPPDGGVTPKQLPVFFDNGHACSGKFPKVPCLCCCRINMVRHPVLDVPAWACDPGHSG